jgi:cytochrome c biogenesis protein CcmG/thiol:disulfide interchange protein DsbE
VAEGLRRSPARAIIVVSVAILVLTTSLLVLLVPLGDTSPDGDRMVVKGHPLLGQPAPEIDLETIDGDRVTLSSLRGRPVVVNFWATWCIPCRDEFPLMVAAYEERAADGLEILGIVHDDVPELARAFAADYGARWPMLVDPADEAWRDYEGAIMPTSLFIDRDGIVRSVSLGGFTRAGLEAQLRRILTSSQPSPSQGALYSRGVSVANESTSP